MQTPQRRQIHGGASPQYVVTTEMRHPPSAPEPRTPKWKGTLVGALIGLLIVMMLLMKWLMDHQVEAADQRRAQEAAGRTAAARCFAQASHRATDACLKGLEMKGGLTD